MNFLSADWTLAVRSHNDMSAPNAGADMFARLGQSVLVICQADDTLFLGLVRVRPVWVQSISLFKNVYTSVGENLLLDETHYSRRQVKLQVNNSTVWVARNLGILANSVHNKREVSFTAIRRWTWRSKHWESYEAIKIMFTECKLWYLRLYCTYIVWIC